MIQAGNESALGGGKNAESSIKGTQENKDDNKPRFDRSNSQNDSREVSVQVTAKEPPPPVSAEDVSAPAPPKSVGRFAVSKSAAALTDKNDAKKADTAKQMDGKMPVENDDLITEHASPQHIVDASQTQPTVAVTCGTTFNSEGLSKVQATFTIGAGSLELVSAKNVPPDLNKLVTSPSNEQRTCATDNTNRFDKKSDSAVYNPAPLKHSRKSEEECETAKENPATSMKDAGESKSKGRFKVEQVTKSTAESSVSQNTDQKFDCRPKTSHVDVNSEPADSVGAKKLGPVAGTSVTYADKVLGQTTSHTVTHGGNLSQNLEPAGSLSHTEEIVRRPHHEKTTKQDVDSKPSKSTESTSTNRKYPELNRTKSVEEKSSTQEYTKRTSSDHNIADNELSVKSAPGEFQNTKNQNIDRNYIEKQETNPLFRLGSSDEADAVMKSTSPEGSPRKCISPSEEPSYPNYKISVDREVIIFRFVYQTSRRDKLSGP